MLKYSIYFYFRSAFANWHSGQVVSLKIIILLSAIMRASFFRILVISSSSGASVACVGSAAEELLVLSISLSSYF